MSLSKKPPQSAAEKAKSKAEKLAEGHDKVEKSLPQSKTRPRITRVISIANVQLIGNGTDRSMNGVVVVVGHYILLLFWEESPTASVPWEIEG